MESGSSNVSFRVGIMKKMFLILACLLCISLFASCGVSNNGDESVGSCENTAEEPSHREVSDLYESSVEPEEKSYVENIADYTIITDENGEQCIAKYNGSDPYIIVPAEHDGKPITKVLPETFDNCKFIRGIKVSEGIVGFGFIDESSALEIKCTSIEEISLPSTLKWCGGFTWCASLKEIVLPEGVTMIGLGAFYGCSSLERAIMPGVRSLQLDSFSGCHKLTELVLADDYQSFGKRALMDTAITELHLPDTFKTVAPGGFPTDCKLYMSKKLYNDELVMSMVRTETGSGISILIELAEGSGVYYTERENDYSFLKNEDGEFYIDKYIGKDEYIIIPPEYLFSTVKCVSSDAFVGCDFIRGIKVGTVLAQNEEFMENLRAVLPYAEITE